MKTKLLALLITIITVCAVCTACGSSVSVEGTWYSVVDTAMYNFSGGEITVSGVTVGQYEDNRDSVVISLMADETNLQLYVTKMNDIDVLADVKEGNGNIYFCKGLENAQEILESTILDGFKLYLSENLIGKWEIWDPYDEDGMDYVDFVNDELIHIIRFGDDVVECPISEVKYGMNESEPYAEFWVYWGGQGDPISIVITPAFDDYMERHELYMDGDRWLQKVD